MLHNESDWECIHQPLKNYKQLHQELMSCKGSKGDDTQFYGNLNYVITSESLRCHSSVYVIDEASVQIHLEVYPFQQM